MSSSPPHHLLPGATAYIARTTTGPQLMLGDVSHTRWGWRNEVEPSTFSHDRVQSVGSFAKLKAFANANPQVLVHPGHQSL